MTRSDTGAHGTTGARVHVSLLLTGDSQSESPGCVSAQGKGHVQVHR